MNEQDYVFLKYIDRFFNNRFLSLLISEYERGISLLKRRKVKDFVDSKKEINNISDVLFLYILFKRTKPNTYLKELEKNLASKFNKLSLKQGKKRYETLKNTLDMLELDQLTVTPDVIKNVREFIIN